MVDGDAKALLEDTTQITCHQILGNRRGLTLLVVFSHCGTRKQVVLYISLLSY